MNLKKLRYAVHVALCCPLDVVTVDYSGLDRPLEIEVDEVPISIDGLIELGGVFGAGDITVKGKERLLYDGHSVSFTEITVYDWDTEFLDNKIQR